MTGDGGREGEARAALKDEATVPEIPPAREKAEEEAGESASTVEKAAAVELAAAPQQKVETELLTAQPLPDVKDEQALIADAPPAADAPAAAPSADVNAAEKASASANPKWLSPATMVERLCLNSDALVAEVHATALRQVQAEDQREGRLDAKAQALLGTAGLSLTVAFTFGGILVQHPEYVRNKILPSWAVGVCYGIALALGLAASIQALRALWVRGTKGIDEIDVFNQEELAASDVETAGGGISRYKRYMAVHIWRIYQTHADINSEKAATVKLGQWLFVGFLVSLLVIGGGMAMSAYQRLCETSATATTTATGADPPPSQAPSRPPPTSIPGGGAPLEKGEAPAQPISQPHKHGGQR